MKRWYMMLALIFFAGCYYKKSPEMRLCSRLDWQSMVNVFPKNVAHIHTIKNKSIAIMNEMLESLEQSNVATTFFNTVRLYDNAKFKFIMNKQILSAISMLSSDPALRVAADHAVMKLQQYEEDKLMRSPILLNAFRNYVKNGNDDQSKTSSTRFFLQKSINHLEHEGANLSHHDIAKLKKLSKEIAHLESQFMHNIANHHRHMYLHPQELQGVSPDLLAGFDMHGHQYKILLNYDIFFAILENCSNAATRQKVFVEFSNRAYPVNEAILDKLLQKRDEYAHLVGYENFAEYESSLQMVGSVQRARDFIYDIIEHTQNIVQKESDLLLKDLPQSVMLSSSGKLQPWDEAFVKNNYRKKHFNIDAMQVAQYFPISHVLHQIQQQFGQFFALAFDQSSNHGLWSDDLICVQVRLLQTSEIIGYLIFDLYARPGKSEQASQINVIPTIQDDCSLACSGMSIIATNFTKPAEGQEKLLEFHDVKILLHEFGHALHELFGATGFVDFTGTKVPRDFVEVPSQLFEMWMDNAAMVKAFSKHYQTGQQLSDAVIQKIIASEKFGRASLLQRQCLLSLISLEFGSRAHAEKPSEIVEKLYKFIRSDVQYDSQAHFETTFDHLITYGSHYYGYVWSQVLAAGLFEYISKNGITSSQVGQKLYTSLLAHGGSQDPHTLIELLLGSSVDKKSLLNSLQV